MNKGNTILIIQYPIWKRSLTPNSLFLFHVFKIRHVKEVRCVRDFYSLIMNQETNKIEASASE